MEEKIEPREESGKDKGRKGGKGRQQETGKRTRGQGGKAIKERVLHATKRRINQTSEGNATRRGENEGEVERRRGEK